MKDLPIIIASLTLAGTLAILYLLLKKKKDEQPPDEDNGDLTGYFSSMEIYEGNSLINSIKGELSIMAVKLTNTQQASGVLTFKDKKLEITDVPDGAASVETADPEIATASYEDATNKVTVKALKSGVTALKIKATNKSGNDIPFEDIAIEVTSGDAATGGVEFSEPTEQEEE